MNKEVSYGFGGLVLGIVLTLAVFGIASRQLDRNGRSDRMFGQNEMHSSMMQDLDEKGNDSSMGTAMDMMNSSLQNKEGDDFDKEFLSEMIVHHQGAVEMANLALKNANHQEIKDLANKIISAQNAEITQMKDWQKQWFSK